MLNRDCILFAMNLHNLYSIISANSIVHKLCLAVDMQNIFHVFHMPIFFSEEEEEDYYNNHRGIHEKSNYILVITYKFDLFKCNYNLWVNFSTLVRLYTNIYLFAEHMQLLRVEHQCIHSWKKTFADHFYRERGSNMWNYHRNMFN